MRRHHSDACASRFINNLSIFWEMGLSGAANAPKMSEMCNAAGGGTSININAEYKEESMARAQKNETDTVKSKTVTTIKALKISISLSLVVLLATLVP